MARFLKHIGKHGDRKVAIVFRQIPGEDHMCLVCYTELLNQNIHDPMIACIESDMGQSSTNLADALNRAYTKNGQIILQVLHREGMLKKVQTAQIVVTPAPNQSVKLDELNALLNEMEKGEEAIKRLAEIEASRGLQDPKDVARRMRETQERARSAQQQTTTAPLVAANGALDDGAISNNLRAQAARMEAEARGLLAEAERLISEANQMAGMMNTAASAQAEQPKAKKARVKKVKIQESVAVSADPVSELNTPLADVNSVIEKPKRATRQRKAAMAG